MAETNRSSVYPSKFVGATTLNLTQVHNVRYQTGSSKSVIIPGGGLNPAGIPLMYAQPMATFSTHDLVSVLEKVSISNGFACTGGAIIQFQNRTQGGTFEGSGAHTKLTSTLGWLGISGISASQDGDAEMQLTYWALYDGEHEPLTASAAATLELSPAYVSKFSLGPVYVNGVEMPGIQSVSVNPGVNYQTNRESGDIYARTGSIYSRTPSLSMTTFWSKIAGQTNILFNASIPGATAFYLYKKLSGGANVAAATGEHGKFSAASGVWSIDDGGAGDGDATTTVTVQAIGTIAATTASAIGG